MSGLFFFIFPNFLNTMNNIRMVVTTALALMLSIVGATPALGVDRSVTPVFRAWLDHFAFRSGAIPPSPIATTHVY